MRGLCGKYRLTILSRRSVYMQDDIAFFIDPDFLPNGRFPLVDRADTLPRDRAYFLRREIGPQKTAKLHLFLVQPVGIFFLHPGIKIPVKGIDDRIEIVPIQKVALIFPVVRTAEYLPQQLLIGQGWGVGHNAYQA